MITRPTRFPSWRGINGLAKTSQGEGVCGDKLACRDDPRIMSDKSIRQNTPIPAWQNTQMETWQNTNSDICRNGTNFPFPAVDSHSMDHSFPGRKFHQHKICDVTSPMCVRNIEACIKHMSFEICGHFDKRRAITNLVRCHNALIPILLTNRFAATFLLFAPLPVEQDAAQLLHIYMHTPDIYMHTPESWYLIKKEGCGDCSHCAYFYPLLWGPSATQTDLRDKRWHEKKVAWAKRVRARKSRERIKATGRPDHFMFYCSKPFPSLHNTKWPNSLWWNGYLRCSL